MWINIGSTWASRPHVRLTSAQRGRVAHTPIGHKKGSRMFDCLLFESGEGRGAAGLVLRFLRATGARDLVLATDHAIFGRGRSARIDPAVASQRLS